MRDNLLLINNCFISFVRISGLSQALINNTLYGKRGQINSSLPFLLYCYSIYSFECLVDMKKFTRGIRRGSPYSERMKLLSGTRLNGLGTPRFHSCPYLLDIAFYEIKIMLMQETWNLSVLILQCLICNYHLLVLIIY